MSGRAPVPAKGQKRPVTPLPRQTQSVRYPFGYTEAECLAAQIDAERLGYRSSRMIAKEAEEAARSRAALASDSTNIGDNSVAACLAVPAPQSPARAPGSPSSPSAAQEAFQPGKGRQGPPRAI